MMARFTGLIGMKSWKRAGKLAERYLNAGMNGVGLQSRPTAFVHQEGKENGSRTTTVNTLPLVSQVKVP